MIKEAINYAKETELHFNEIKFEALKYSQSGNEEKLKYLFQAREIYRKDNFEINDQCLQDAIGQCNKKIYDLSKIVNDMSTFKEKAAKIKDFDFATPSLKIINSRILYETNSYKKAKAFRNIVLIISLIILMSAMGGVFYTSIKS